MGEIQSNLKHLAFNLSGTYLGNNFKGSNMKYLSEGIKLLPVNL